MIDRNKAVGKQQIKNTLSFNFHSLTHTKLKLIIFLMAHNYLKWMFDVHAHTGTFSHMMSISLSGFFPHTYTSIVEL